MEWQRGDGTEERLLLILWSDGMWQRRQRAFPGLGAPTWDVDTRTLALRRSEEHIRRTSSKVGSSACLHLICFGKTRDDRKATMRNGPPLRWDGVRLVGSKAVGAYARVPHARVRRAAGGRGRQTVRAQTFGCHRLYCSSSLAPIVSVALVGSTLDGSNQQSSFEHGFVLTTSGGSTPMLKHSTIPRFNVFIFCSAGRQAEGGWAR